jgi:hypothetical protein
MNNWPCFLIKSNFITSLSHGTTTVAFCNNFVIQRLTAERHTGTQQMIYIDRLQNNFITTIIFLSPRIK